MRLIDADKVAENVYDRIEKDLCRNTPPYNCDELEVCLPKEDYEYLRGLNDARDCAVNTINKEPTVKAIPVGWISKYSRKPISNADYWAIMRMVTAWEEENEKQKVG